MAIKRVNADVLNLRQTPVNGTILEELPRGHAVTITGATRTAGWVAVSTQVGGATVTGVVAERRLRDPVSDPKEQLMSAAVAEWLRFEMGTGQEHVDPFFKFVGEMWQSIGLDLDGKDRDTPWSAAFISFCVRKAGITGFKFAAAHSRYIHDAIVKRFANQAAPFWGFRITEQPPRLGDMVCQWRKNRKTFDDARVEDAFFSHCDIVVEVGDTFVRALGGNNTDTVGFKKYNLNANGFLKDEKNVFAVLHNRL
jgi:hypothetical protein